MLKWGCVDVPRLVIHFRPLLWDWWAWFWCNDRTKIFSAGVPLCNKTTLQKRKSIYTELGVNIFCILALLLFNKQWLGNNALSIQLQKVLIVSWLSSILMISVQIWSLQFLCKIIVKNKKRGTGWPIFKSTDLNPKPQDRRH